MPDWHATGIAVAGPAAAVAANGLGLRIGGVRLLVADLGDAWVAVADRCSHAGCAFSEDGEIDGERIICDCHGSEFDLRTGRVMRPPAVEPVPTFRTRVVDGRLEVEI